MRPSSASVLFLAFLSLTGVSFSLTLVSSCMNITGADTYQLTGNLQGVQHPADFENCIYISSSDVILDCMGYNITNNATFGEGISAILARGASGAPITNVTIRNCGLYGYTDAIQVSYATNALVTGNTGRNNSDCAFRFDIHTNDSSFVNNTAYDRALCLYGPTDRINVTDNTCNNTGGASAAYGIILWGGDNNHTLIGSNRFYNQPLTCIYASAAHHGIFVNNTVSGCGWSCLQAEGVNHTIANNTLSGGSDYGIYVSSSFTPSSGITITNNTLYGNTDGGIFITDSLSNTLSRNTVFRNARGIHVRDSNATLSGDHVYNNTVDMVINSTASSVMSANLTGVIFDSPAGAYLNFTNISLNDSLAPGTGYAMDWSNRTNGFSFARKMLTINASGGAPSIDSVVWNWRQDEITVGYRESGFELWKYNGTWNLLNESPDTAGDALSLSSLSSFSDFAILTTSCPVINSSGTYQLMRNSSNAPNRLTIFSYACILVNGTSDVLLDCGGYNITQVNSTASDTYGIRVIGPATNVTVRNCPRIYNYTYGMTLASVNDSTVSNVTVNTAWYRAFELISSARNNITGNTATFVANDVFDFQSSPNSYVANNTAMFNDGVGFTFYLSDYFNAVNNLAYSNQYAGFRVDTSNFSNLTSNRAFNNSPGFYVIDSQAANLTGNTAWGGILSVWGSGDGFSISGSSNVNLTGNTVNGTVNISADMSNSDVTLRRNTLYGAMNYGVQAQDAVSLRMSGDHLYNNARDARFESSGPASPINLTNVVFDSPAGSYANFTNISLYDAMEAGAAYLINWSRNSSALPAGRSSFAQKFVDITAVSGSPSIDSILWNWNDGELAGYNESRFSLWKYNASGWAQLNGTPDTAANTLRIAGHSPASTYAILELNDTTAPNVTLNAPANNSLFNFTSLLFNFTATDDLASSLSCSLYVDGTLNMTNASTQNGTLTAFSTGVGNGNHSWFVNCSDGANSNLSEARNVSVDTLPPSISFIPYTDASGIVVPRNWFAFHINASDANLDNMTYWIYNSTSLVFNSTAYASALIDASVNWTGAPAGIYYFNATAWDRAGHANSTETRNVTLDLSGPVVSLNSPADNQSFSAGNVAFNFTATDDLSAVLNCSLYLDGAYNRSNASTQNGTQTSFSVTGIPQGRHSWYVNCTDGGANAGASAPRNVIVDLAPPAVSLNSPADGSTETSSTVTFSFTSVDNLSATMSCTLYLDAIANQTSAGVVNNTATAFIVSGIGLGLHNWSVMCTDSAGNIGYSDTRNVTVAQPPAGTSAQQVTPTLSVSITPVCGGYVVTVESDGARVPGALVSVYVGGKEVETAYSNNSGQIAFVGCGMDVEVRAAKGGVQGSKARNVACVACTECTLDTDCGGNERCTSGKCTLVECHCGLVQDHLCESYLCCADADCGAGRSCENHQCILSYDCSSDSDCADSQRCEKAGGAARGYCVAVSGECGRAVNHAWVKYMCGDGAGCDTCPQGSNCTGHVCVAELKIRAPDTGFVGEGVNVTVLEGAVLCRNCEVAWTSPAGRTGTGRTDANGNLIIPLNERGQYKVVIVKDPTKAATVNALPKPRPPGEGQPTGVLDAIGPYLLWLLVLLLVIIGAVLYQRRRAGTRSRK